MKTDGAFFSVRKAVVSKLYIATVTLTQTVGVYVIVGTHVFLKIL